MKDSTSPWFRLVKIADIGYITVVYFIIGYYLGYYLDLAFGKLYGTQYSTKTRTQLILEILSQSIVLGIIFYLGRNISGFIPSPLDGVAGLEHGRVKELTSAGSMVVFIMMFQYTFVDKLRYLKELSQKTS